MENWVIMRKGAPFDEIARKFRIHPVVARLIRNRGITGDDEIDFYLNGTIADLYDGMLMRDMDKAVDILTEKIREGRKIRIIGDYDVDGVNAAYILLEGLGMLGGIAEADIPDRVRDGYGLNREMIDRAFDDGADTILTCDNGIAAAEEVGYAESLGMTVVVTDHHEVPFTGKDGEKSYVIPPADAVVDPKRSDCPYPFKELCGTAVAYKLLEALFEANGRDAEEIDFFMENVAIATVCDVTDLVGENRIFVKQGLEMLGRTKNPGLKALIGSSLPNATRLTAYHIGFVIGPCLNAGGRLDSAKKALDLLRARDAKEADMLAGDLKALNDSRKARTTEAEKDAVRLVEETELKNDKVLVIFLPGCHESLAGIVAGRVRERYGKPTFVVTKTADGLKGSGRSVDAYDMYEGLSRCRELLVKYGGHKTAAGFTLRKENLPELRKELNLGANLAEEDLIPRVSIDMRLAPDMITGELTEQLSLIEPCGKANPRPLFAEKDLELKDFSVAGKNRNVLRFKVRRAGCADVDAVYFGDALAFTEYYRRKGRNVADLTYYPEINEYGGRKNIQIVVRNYR